MFKKLLTGLILISISTISYANELISFEQEQISINIPADWNIIKKEQVDHIKNTASSTINQHIESRTILGATSHVNDHFGQIRLSINDNITLTENMLLGLKQNEMMELKLEAERSVQKSSQKAGMTIFNINASILYSPKIATLISYIRSGKNNSYWLVKMYRFPDSKHNREIMLTLSYDLSQKDKFEPILNNVLQSLKF